MFRRLYPGQEPVPAPFLVSFDQLAAVAYNPTMETVSQYVSQLQTHANEGGSFEGDVLSAPDPLIPVYIFLDIVRQTGALPEMAPNS